MKTTTIPTVPEAFESNDRIMIVVNKLLTTLEANEHITSGHLEWLEASVYSLKRYAEMTFSKEEETFFFDCLNKAEELVNDRSDEDDYDMDDLMFQAAIDDARECNGIWPPHPNTTKD